ncbi:hypothetical protein TPY_0490 [Sulfobacillus acidophilus TPY]|nr:hypothetical protein TPY_0490 [Sulfobacillus acidophilus TPY]
MAGRSLERPSPSPWVFGQIEGDSWATVCSQLGHEDLPLSSPVSDGQ